MFGVDKTYFADSPVVINISGLEWPENSPFNVVRLEVLYNDSVVGNLNADSGGQSSISFDVSTALRAIWMDYEFGNEVAAAQRALSAATGQSAQRLMRTYKLRIHTEYLSDDEDRTFVSNTCVDSLGNEEIPGGQCLIGRMTEWERSLIANDADADVSSLEHTGVRNGDASTKPISSPERVGCDSITSWTDVSTGLTKSIFYPSDATPEHDDTPSSQQGWTGHAPIVVRDSEPYTDFLFVNRRGALETCSAQMLESMNVNVSTKQHSLVGRPSFKPSRTLTSITQEERRSWKMSSGLQTREWAEWWAFEFLTARRWWMLYKGRFVPVIVEPASSSTGIYDLTKQQMPSVEFNVTLALEG